MNESNAGDGRNPSPGQSSVATVVVRCRENGPLVVELPAGEPAVVLRVTDHLGGEFPLPQGKRAVAFCRCAQTKNRPFCDGSHKECGFLAADTAPAAE